MSFQTVSAILRGKWLIDRSFADSHLPLIQSLISKADFSAGKTDKDGMDTIESERLQKWPTAGSLEAGTFTDSKYKSFNDAPENSIAYINISGPILKYGGECGEPGAQHFTSWIKMANASPKITGILLNIDSPGGMVDGTQSLVDAIKSSKKPIVAFIDDGMMASAATWIGSAATEIYASQKTDTIGSIGVYCTIYDFKGYFEKNGVKIHEIYAPQSTDKNKDYRDAIEGKYDGIKSELQFIADEFINSVKENRAGKLNISKENPFTGKMYPAEEAMSIGLIDGITTIENAVERVYQLAKNETNYTF